MPAAIRKPRRAVSESTLVTAILGALKMKGIFAWRANSGTQVIKAEGSHARRVIRGADAGTPDILLVLPVYADVAVGQTERLGVLAGLEVKTATGKLQPSQVAWHARAEKFGVRVGVCRSVGEALALVQNWSGGR